MKSRKSAKATRKSQRADLHRQSLRGALRTFETLEDRRLMTVEPWSDGLYYPPIGKTTAFLPSSITSGQYRAISDQQYAGTPRNAELTGEGLLPFITTSEIEPNNAIGQATYINIGTSGANKSDGVAVIGNLSVPAIPGTPFLLDEDYFSFDLQAGDILDARVEGLPGAVFDLSILDSNRQTIYAVNAPAPAGTYPIGSPLDVSGTNSNADLAFVIPATGRYYARVSDGDSFYTLTMRARRPVLESEPVGTKQTVFLDFDGETLRREIFGVPGTGRLSPLSDFLPGWGLTAADESRMIDKIISQFTDKFVGLTGIRATGGNGYYSATGVAGQFDIEILNSRDNTSPWGLSNVTRIIIGGTQTELGIPTVGIAQSLDVGNFATAETAVVLLDEIGPGWGVIPRAGNVPAEDIFADAIGSVAAHEAGHLFGTWHTLNNNASDQIMDTGGNYAALVGVGPDGIYGNDDDVDVQFGTDRFDPATSLFLAGSQNSAASVAWGLSTGKTGGATFTGTVFNDRNANRNFDTGDLGISGVTVYADSNGNGVLDSTEVRSITNASGAYQLTVLPGTYTIREVIPTGYQLLSPAGGYTASITAGQTISGRNFANEKVDQTYSGYKWNDANGNGIKDAGESGIGGVYIYLDLDGDNRIDIGEPTSVTKADGTFTLTFPGAGTYTIREVMQPGFSQTVPGLAVGNPDPRVITDEEYTVVVTGNPTVDGPNLAGIKFGNRLTLDFGDAPASYGSASAGYLAGLTLGTLWDAEVTVSTKTDGLGDDTTGIDDEDGIESNDPLPLRVGSSTNPVTLVTTNTTGQTAYLQAWIDFNADGDFDDTIDGISEHVVTDLAVTSAALPTFNITVPASAKVGDSFARIRLSNVAGVGPSGQATSGEVEDYAVLLRPNTVAVDDTGIVVPRNSPPFFIDVLANDFLPLKVTNVSQPAIGGTVTFTDAGVTFTPTPGYIGPVSFSYQMQTVNDETSSAQVDLNVVLSFANPVAVDDSFDVPTNSISFPLNVLANDIEGQNGALTIVSATQPDKGGVITMGSGNKSLIYTPSRDFGGTEFFVYTATDAAGNQSTAKVTVHTLPGDRTDDDIEIRLQPTDLAGNPISRIQQGQQFRIDVIVDDLRYDAANPSPTLDAGVFAAYTDLLYNLQLVGTIQPTASTPTGFNFAVDYFNSYTSGQTGDASVPGIVNELGAFFSDATMNRPGPTKLASVIFEAKTPGVARFMPDPADVFPASDSLLFDTPANAVPIENISYIGATIQIVGNGVVFPTAVDDSPTTNVPVATATVPVNFSIDVLANDLPGSNGPISIKSVAAGLHGNTSIVNGKVNYVPNLNYQGSDQFTYTIVDSQGTESTATVTLRVGDASTADDIIDLQLRVTDLSGNEISQVAVGSKFKLRGFVKDLRSRDADPSNPSRRGVFAAYQDVIFSPGLVSTVASTANNPNLGFVVSFGSSYQRVREGDVLTRGLINEIGAVATLDTPTNTDEYLLFEVTLTANAVGTASFVGDPADISPFHDSLTYEPVMVVSYDHIRYGFDSVEIVNATGSGEGEYTNASNPLDVNADGYVSPIDALAIINALNIGGSRQLVSASGEGEGRLFVDTNADGFLSPMDVLNVINYLNAGSAGQGEGESGLQGEGELYSDELFDDGVDSLIAQLAPDIELSWKKNRGA